MKPVRLLLLALLLGLAACADMREEVPPDCYRRAPDPPTDGGVGGTGHVDCPPMTRGPRDDGTKPDKP